MVSCVHWRVEMCIAQLAVKMSIYPYTWNLLMQSMVLQMMGSNYHAHLKYFGITNGGVFGVKNIVQVSTFKYIWFCNGTLTF